jgi:hypothetical protein
VQREVNDGCKAKGEERAHGFSGGFGRSGREAKSPS